jgi:hypothetical protein
MILPATPSFLPRRGIKGLQDTLDLFFDMQFFPVEVFELLRFAPRLRKLVFELAHAAPEVLVLDRQQPHPPLDLRESVLKVLQYYFPRRNYSGLPLSTGATSAPPHGNERHTSPHSACGAKALQV